MKSMAAANISRFRSASESVDGYVANIRRAVTAVLMDRELDEFLQTPRGGAAGLIIFGSAHGLCGQFNRNIADHTAEAIERFGIDPEKSAVFVLGDRVESLLREHGISVDASTMISGSMGEVHELMQEVVDIVESWEGESEISRVYLHFNRPTKGSTVQPSDRLLLPVEPGWLMQAKDRIWTGPTIPMLDGDSDYLFAMLRRQYFFAVLYQAYLDSLAAENTARLAAMQAAERNIDERLSDLSSQFNRLRQTAITSELLDIISGYESLS